MDQQLIEKSLESCKLKMSHMGGHWNRGAREHKLIDNHLVVVTEESYHEGSVGGIQRSNAAWVFDLNGEKVGKSKDYVFRHQFDSKKDNYSIYFSEIISFSLEKMEVVVKRGGGRSDHMSVPIEKDQV